MTQPSPTGVRHIVFVQNSDFWGDATRIAESGEEIFFAQAYSMKFVSDLVEAGNRVSVICVNREEAFRRTLPSGIDVISLTRPASRSERLNQVTDALACCAPTDVILRLPNIEAIDWCCRNGVRVMPNLADSFTPRRGLRSVIDRWRFRRLARLINSPGVEFVSNHNVAASQDLARLGAAKSKIIPWDWPPATRPEDFEPRSLADKPVHDLLFVGQVKEAKGVGDLIRAFGASADLQARCRLTIIGMGDLAAMEALAEDQGVADHVSIKGRVPLHEILPAMRAHDLLLVYSRAEYTEGLPSVIYEGMTARTPVVMSDHPMFTQYFETGVDAVMVPSAQPELLAHEILALLDNPALYRALSEHSAETYRRIRHPLTWGELMERWLRNAPEDKAWMAENALPRWENRSHRA